MCGIVGYIGHRDAYPVLISGLKRLEYRGYDSAGVALMNGQGLIINKKKGKVSGLDDHMQSRSREGCLGIGHTRWATHGEPNDVNAHPHTSSEGGIALVHNGIIENYEVLKQELLNKGHTFRSDTDSEVAVRFIEDIYTHNGCSLDEAVRIALTRIVGAYAMVIISEDYPDQLIAVRKSSPLVIGIGSNEYFIASDATPIIEYTKEVIYLNDMEVAVIKKDHIDIRDLDAQITNHYIQKIDLELEAIEKGGFDHFMLKEIVEQPQSLANAMRGRLNRAMGTLQLGGISRHLPDMVAANRIIILGCGTSWHAGLVAEYFFEEWCRVPVEVEYASEFRYRDPIIRKGDVVIAISQSGETADTLAAIELAKERGAIIIGVCNVVGSSIARASHEGAYIHAGPEIGVASTKAFTAQVTVLAMMALKIASERSSISQSYLKELINALAEIPDKVERVLMQSDQIYELAKKFKNASNFLYLGRGYNFPVALEGALKLKEISYIHAEGYPAAEMKHGPIALIDDQMPVVFVATKDSSYEKIITNVQEVKARKGQVICIVNENDTLIPALADHVIEVPQTLQPFVPIIAVVPLQLLSYHIAVSRGCNVDQPRNLAKSVTVE